MLCGAVHDCLVWVVRRVNSTWTCWLKTAGFPPSLPEDPEHITGTKSCGAHGARGGMHPIYCYGFPRMPL